ncbi:MAG: RNA polymerase sigma factor [Candidatus Brocadiia bacterium]
MITAEFKLNGSTYIDRWLAALAQVDYTADESLSWADNSDITAIMSGNRNAFGGLVKRYQDKITAKMWRFTRDKQQLEILVQEVFVEAYKSLGSFRQGSPFLPWLIKIAVRTGYRHWNKTARTSKEVSLDRVGEIMSNDVVKEPSQAGELLHSLLSGLPPKDRLVLTLIYFEGCSMAEAAELTGWSLIMTKVRSHRARNKLKELVEKTSARG